MKPFFILVLATLTASMLCGLLAAVPPTQSKEVKTFNVMPRHGTNGAAFIIPRIITGTPKDTLRYYAQVGVKLGLRLVNQAPANDPPFSLNSGFTLDDLLAFAGFGDGHGGGLLAKDVDQIPSPNLNDPAALANNVSNPDKFKAFFDGIPLVLTDKLAEKEILAVSYFAPKICNVGDIKGPSSTTTEPDKYGWRKTVRLHPRNPSAAAANGIKAIWLNFNYFVKKELMNQPLSLSGSVNTQVFIEYSTFQTTPQVTAQLQPILNDPNTPPLKDAAYWLDFLDTPSGSPLTAALNASFDSGQGDIPGDPQEQSYYVPTACAVCHGDDRSTAALNALDTDHWFERVRLNAPAGIDFASLANSPVNGVLLDGGKDTGTPQFAAVFSVFVELNAEIQVQNKMSGAFLQPISTNNWLAGHANTIQPLTLAQRAIPGQGGVTWQAADEALLSHFDRYCYRCHNAVRYNVFLKDQVTSPFILNQIKSRIQLPWTPETLQTVMPQDRHLDASIVNKFLQLLP